MVFFSKYFDIRGYFFPVTAAVVVGVGALWWYKTRKNRRYYKPVGVVSGLNVYPVKSCQGISLSEASCLQKGIEYDRCLVLLNDKDDFVTQRQEPSLALVKTTIHENEKLLQLEAPGMETLQIPLEVQDRNETKMIRVWRTTCEGVFAGQNAADWFSKYLKGSFQLYHCASARCLIDDSKWGDVSQPQDKVQFADFAAYLLTTESSLEDLNSILPYPVTMKRFRPNIVIGGLLEPYVEDNWEHIKIGDAEFRLLKQCHRCILTKVDPEKGVMDPDEPLATLKRTRLSPNERYSKSPLFGIHLASEKEGRIRIGDTVFVSTNKTRCRNIFPLFT